MIKKRIGRASPGQALLIMILVMAVAVTIGLAVVSRSLTDIKVSIEQEESARVFSVAEAGIEEALLAGSEQTLTIGEITAVVEELVDPALIGGGQEFVFSKSIEADDAQSIWLVAHNESGLPDPAAGRYLSLPENQIEVCWGNEAIIGQTPALEAALYYRIDSEFYTQRYAIDPDRVIRGNNFDDPDSAAGCLLAGQTLMYSETLSLPGLPGASDGYFLLRLKLLYNDEAHLLGVRAAGSNNPDISYQGQCFESTATHTETGLTRKVRHCQPFQAPPEIFDYVLYSTSDLAKAGVGGPLPPGATSTPTPPSAPTSTPTSPPPPPPPAPGPLLHATLESEADVNSQGGTVNGGRFLAGYNGNGYEVDANGEYVYFPMSGNLSGRQGTIDFWYLRTDAPANYGRFFSSSEGSNEFLLGRFNSNRDIFINLNDQGDTIWSSVPNVFDREWHQIRLTYDTINDSYYLYIDGQSQGEKTTSYNGVDIDSYDILIGNRFLPNERRPIGGIIDDFKIYDGVAAP